MADLSFEGLLKVSWERSKKLLLPFDLKHWLRLLLVFWLSGGMFGGGGGDAFELFNRDGGEQTATQQANDDAVTVLPGDDQAGAADGSDELLASDASADPDAVPAEGIQKWMQDNPGAAVWAVVILLPLFVAIFVVMMWLGARFIFIRLDFVINGRVGIRESFSRHKSLGNSYFKFSLALVGFSLLAFVIIGFLSAVAFKWLWWLIIPVSIVLIIGISLAGWLVAVFVTPMMCHDKETVSFSIKKFLGYKLSVKTIALYALQILLLSIAGAIVVGIITFIIGLIIALLVLIPVLIGGIIVGALPFLESLGVVFGILVMVVGLPILIIVMSIPGLPLSVFTGYFSLAWLTRLIPAYNLLGLPTDQQDSPEG